MNVITNKQRYRLSRVGEVIWHLVVVNDRRTGKVTSWRRAAEDCRGVVDLAIGCHPAILFC